MGKRHLWRLQVIRDIDVAARAWLDNAVETSKRIVIVDTATGERIKSGWREFCISQVVMIDPSRNEVHIIL